MDQHNKLPGRIRTMIIGAFAVLGIAVLVWAIFFFKPKVGDNKNRLMIRFSNIESIDIGTRVTYAGKPVGEVIEIEQIINAREKSTDESGNPFAYQVVVSLDSAVQVYDTDLIEIRTSGLLGEKSIAILPQHLKPGEAHQSVLDGVIYAQSADPLTSTLNTVTQASSKIAETMAKISTLIEKNSESVSQSIQSLNTIFEETSHLLYQANQLDILGSFNRAAIDISQLMKSTNQVITTIQDYKIIEKVDATVDNLAFITENIADGKGSLGKLINDPTLYLQAMSMLERVNQLIYDLNNYGLLFHRNRRWKQAQQERLEQLSHLKSPDAFTQAFQDEMSKINISLEKVSHMVEEADMGNEEIIDSNEFKQYFHHLLNEVNRLQNLIELYNQKMTGP